MGFGGFYLHSRIGLDTDYLGEEYMDAVKACIRCIKENGIKSARYGNVASFD